MDVRSSYLTVGLSFSLRHVTDGDPILLGRHGMPGRDACNCDGGSRPRMRRPPFRNEEKRTEGEYCTTKRGSGKPASAQSIASNSTPLLSSNQSAKKAHVAFTTFPVQTILAFKFLGRGRQSWFPRLQLKHCPPIAISQLWCPSQSTTWASPPR